MFPWGQLPFAYLCYAGLARYRTGRGRCWCPSPVLAVAALGPNLVDKPLAWSLGLLAHGRSLGHSLPVAVPAVVLLLWALADHRSLVGSLGVGWGSHPFPNGLRPLLEGDYAALGYLLWPVTRPPPAEVAPTFRAHLLAVSVGP